MRPTATPDIAAVAAVLSAYAEPAAAVLSAHAEPAAAMLSAHADAAAAVLSAHADAAVGHRRRRCRRERCSAS